ncbi:transcriptional regulator [Pontibacter sp. FD36]|uniref:GbsR/MarR family transcriptional regulator n=1 Tax=Pontibacter sp. FD36 TaxID=2789860 RepID=UPI0018A93451|nr:transcriptional regulator [Pontibacter sp. FD36]MBF8963277.1 transcriptional regulator [Pontibacter sp. FD36]
MEYSEAKERYIEAWGSLGSSWGVNRTMAQIHALLMIATEPLSTEEIMEDLKISRGNANMNIRALLDWGLAKKVLKLGERKEYFVTDKDPMVLAAQVAKERKKRELDPIIRLLDEVSSVKGESKEVQEFKKVTTDLKGFAKQADSVINTFIQSNSNWFFKILGKITR